MSAPHRQSCALVTGGSQGLGLAVARQLTADGCRQIVIAGRDVDKGQQTARQMQADGVDAFFIAVDMGDAGSVRELVDQATQRMGRINVLVNAAADSSRGDVFDTDPQDWDRLMSINLKGPFFAIQRVAQLARAGGHPASVVNILSMVIYCGQSFLAAYSASKAGLANVTRNAAQSLRQHQIRVNGVACGWMNTPGEDAVQRKWHGAGEDWLEKAAAAQPFGKLVEPADVAGLVSYLTGPHSGVMTGSIIDFDQNVAGAYPE
jgi:NAD(P)-dependent dehydrogenase (short-subunit alcohol dehydrogenase family)